MAIQPEVNTLVTRRVLSVHDSAIDKDASNLEAYRENYEAKDLVLKDEEEPTWFTLRPIDHGELQSILCEIHRLGLEHADFYQRLMDECFRAGCSDVEGLRDGDGKEVFFRTESQPGRFRRVRDEVARYVPGTIRRELGLVVWKMSKLEDEQRKNL